MQTPVRLADAGPAPPARCGLACLCAGTTFEELEDAIAADGDATLGSLGALLGCGVQCGSCVPAIREALGQVAWFAATATAKPITRSRDMRGTGRLIYKVDLALADGPAYPKVQPGQHVVLRAHTPRGVVERTYTVVAQDIASRRVTVAIRRKPEGSFTPWLLREDGQARELEVSAPGGPGLSNNGYASAVFLAGGVGVTPAVAMVNALGASAEMHLDYSVADLDDAAFVARFEARQKERRGFTWSIRDTSKTGSISAGDIRKLAARHPYAKFYVCGPEGYVERVHGALRKARVEPARIHIELFALTANRAPARSFRFKAYLAGAVLTVLPLLVLLPDLQQSRPHGHPNVGHEKVKCIACHAESPASTRQALQAKARHLVGLRETGAVLGMQPVTSATCVQCHANPDDRHAPHRFLEPRFEQARAETGAQQCVSCHREHTGVRVTAASTGYCVSCHSQMKVEGDRTTPTHDYLVRNKRWETCLQCHDYHGNHKWRAPLRLVDAATVDVLDRYMKTGPSPFGATVVKAKQERFQ